MSCQCLLPSFDRFGFLVDRLGKVLSRDGTEDGIRLVASSLRTNGRLS